MMTINVDQAIADLGRIVARMADMQPALAVIGQHQIYRIQTRITDEKHDPDDLPWSPWAAFTREQREKKGNVPQGLLWDTGTLLHSIRAQVDLNSVAIGTDVPYAQELQAGRGNMPARPFVGWDDNGLQFAEHFIVKYLEGVQL